MRYAILFLVSVSVMAVEEIQQAVTTEANTPITFELFSQNEGRGALATGTPGNMVIFRLQCGWNGTGGITGRTMFKLNAETGATIATNTNMFSGVNSQFSNEYFTWNSAQAKGLHIALLNCDIDSPPTRGSLTLANSFTPTPPSFSGPQATYTPEDNFLGTEAIVITYRNGGSEFTRLILTISVISKPLPAPTADLDASPTTLLTGGSTSFSPTSNLPATFSYNYGDGNTGSQNTHVYAAPGTFTATVTAVTTNGNATASVTINVFGTDHVPTARFSTSDVVGYVGNPLGFDAFFSTDPQNGALLYSWNFGDGSPLGTGQQIAKVYANAGSYTVALTVTDTEGLSHTITREIEVLPANAVGTFDAEVSFRLNYNRGLVNRDKITLFARLNVGDVVVKKDDVVSVSIGQKTFTGTLDKRLRAINGGQRISVKANLRKQALGTVEIRLNATKTGDLGTALNVLGLAISSDDIETPVDISISGKTFSIAVPSEYDSVLLKGKGAGEF